MAHAAYYGGRFEVTRLGQIGPCVSHDINSAYPAALVELPCLEHGCWIRVANAAAWRRLDLPADALYIANAHFQHKRDASKPLCGLPIRSDKGALYWPREGNGAYWSPELRSAYALGAEIRLGSGFLYCKTCDCQPFDWVRQLYLERKRLGKNGAGYAIKLALNSLYGKLAQRIGSPRWQNPIWAGLITALTRAKLNSAIAAHPDQASVVMLATDAIVTAGSPLAGLAVGSDLGQWEVKHHSRLFVVKPGLYWTESGLKSRGISPRYFTLPDGSNLAAKFEAAWSHWLSGNGELFPGAGSFGIPAVPVEVDLFIGLRLAYRLGKLEQACQWVKQIRWQSFDWRDKRITSEIIDDPSAGSGALVLLPKPGGRQLHSAAYEPPTNATLGDPDGAAAIGIERSLFEAMPDADVYLEQFDPLASCEDTICSPDSNAEPFESRSL